MLEVVIASTRRPQTLQETLEGLAQLKSLPTRVILSLVNEGDFSGIWPNGLHGIVLTEAVGLTSQRNAGIRHLLPDTSVVAFMDDDIFLAADCLSKAEALFAKEPDLMAFSGNVIREGGLSAEQAREILKKNVEPPGPLLTPAEACYGCLFFVRRSVLEKEQFDECLKGYCFLEDVDFGRRVLRHGRVGHYEGTACIHLRLSGGRINHRQFGYTQVVNPLYLYRKGTIRVGELLKCWLTGMAANGWFSLFGSFWKRGPRNYQHRLIGNLHAFLEILAGVDAPERCLRFS